MAAVSPAGPDPTITTCSTSVIDCSSWSAAATGAGCGSFPAGCGLVVRRPPLAPQEGTDAREQHADDEVGEPRVVLAHHVGVEQPHEADDEQHDADRAQDPREDAVDDAAHRGDRGPRGAVAH